MRVSQTCEIGIRVDLNEGCQSRAVQYNACIVCALQITDDMLNCCPMGLTEVMCVLTQLLDSKCDARHDPRTVYIRDLIAWA